MSETGIPRFQNPLLRHLFAIARTASDAGIMEIIKRAKDVARRRPRADVPCQLIKRKAQSSKLC